MSETRNATSNSSNSNSISDPMEPMVEEGTNQQQEHLEQQEENASQPPQQQQQQRPQPQHAESQPATTGEISENNNGHNRPVADPPLPADLRRILVQVAKTGACSWLSWDQVSKDLPPEPANNDNTLNGNPNAASAPTMSASGLSSLAARPPLTASSNAALSSNGANNNNNNNNTGPNNTSSRQPPFSTHRRSTSSPYAPTSSQPPARKKHRNGLHKSSRRRSATTDGSNTQTATGSVPRKRPLFLIRTTTTGTPVNTNPSLFSAGSIAGSVGSGRTSGSEPDGDSTQYECDSEGTSATTNSEVSVERLRESQQRMASAMLNKGETPSHLFLEDGATAAHTSYYKTLQEAFRVALGLVLDHFYSKRGGYKLSPSERRRNATLSLGDYDNKKRTPPLSPDSVFQQRRQRLWTMLMPPHQREDRQRVYDNGPPFTIQRIAEVLVSPERVSTNLLRICMATAVRFFFWILLANSMSFGNFQFYTQTHKLCNCLEKLLLVTSSPGAFGGSMGGDTSQSRREVSEVGYFDWIFSLATVTLIFVVVVF
jgi:hypothetical protein